MEALHPSSPVIDACAFHDWVSKDALLPYVGKGWRDLLAIENVQVKGQWQNQPQVDRAAPETMPPAPTLANTSTSSGRPRFSVSWNCFSSAATVATISSTVSARKASCASCR